jgi:hypothetical protein
MRCLSKDPAGRFARATDLAVALERSLIDEAATVAAMGATGALTRSSPDGETRPSPTARGAVIEADVTSPEDVTFRPVVHDRRPYAVAALLLLLLLLFGGWWSIRGRTDGDPELALRDGGATTTGHAIRPRRPTPVEPVVTPPPLDAAPSHATAPDVAPVDAAVAVVEADAGSAPARSDARPVAPVDHYRTALAAYNAGNYRLAQVEAERAVEARQGGANGLNAREALCVVVNQAPRGADARNKACRYLVASSGCESAAHTTCCAACGQGQ